MKKLVTFLLLLMSVVLPAQKNGSRVFLDSLLRQLPESRADTHKVWLLDQISFTYSRIDPQKGLLYADQLEQLSDSLHWTKGIAASHSDKGVNYAVQMQHSQAIYHYRKAQELYEKLGIKKSVAGVLANIALVYMSEGDYAKALEYDFKALAMDDGPGNEYGRALVMENIGTIYLEQKQYEKAMKYYSDALAVHRKSGNEFAQARVQANIGIVLDAKGDYAGALEHHRSALETNRKYENRNSMQINLANIGVVYSHQKDYGRSLQSHREALRISQSLGIRKDIAVNLGNIGETYYFIATDSVLSITPDSLVPPGKNANLRLAISYLEQAVSLSEELHFTAGLVEFTQFLSDAYALAGDYKKSLAMYRTHVQYNDSVFSDQAKMRLRNVETQRELDLKDREIVLQQRQLQIAMLDDLNKRHERIFYIAGIVVLLLLVAFILGRFILRGRAHRNVLSDIASIQSHEIRGPVARIRGLVMLFNNEEPADPINKELIRHIGKVSEELDDVVKKVVTKTSNDKDRDHTAV